MRIAVDLHAHSMFAGGAGGLSLSVGKKEESLKKAHIRFIEADKTSRMKGIRILGTGDIQFAPWLEFVKKSLSEVEEGFFVYKNSSLRYVLQTEIIVTVPFNRKRKASHVVILFPNIESVENFRHLLVRFGSKIEKMARPFVTLNSPEQCSEFFFEVKAIDHFIEIFPAHILTPEGVYGGNNGVDKLEWFFGEFVSEIRAVETGLSADPEVLALIPELDNKVLLSNSDAHSAAINRIAREFTVLNMSKFDYKGLINSIRNANIEFTLEFPPSEGRFFFTGHRAGRKKPKPHKNNEYCYFSPDKIPKDNICPICGAQLTKGVLHRAFEICQTWGEKRSFENIRLSQRFIHGVPLVEVIATALRLKSANSKKVLRLYERLLGEFGTEVELWSLSVDNVVSRLENVKIPIPVKNAIELVKKDLFGFEPPGFDGQYGKLVLGKKVPYLGQKKIEGNFY